MSLVVYTKRDPSSASASQDASDSPIGAYPRRSYRRRASVVVEFDAKPQSAHAPLHGSCLEFADQQRREPRTFDLRVGRDLPDRACSGLLGEVDATFADGMTVRLHDEVFDLAGVDTPQLLGDVLEVRRAPGPGNELDIGWDELHHLESR